MAVYMIGQITINDRDTYAAYESGFLDIFAQFKGKLLSVDESADVLEGQWPCTRTVLLEFPTKEDALAWYKSDAYQALAQHRFAAADGNIIIVQGMG